MSSADPSGHHEAARRFVRELQSGVDASQHEPELCLRLQQLESLLRRTYAVFSEMCEQQQRLSSELQAVQERLRRVEGWQRMFTEAVGSGAAQADAPHWPMA